MVDTHTLTGNFPDLLGGPAQRISAAVRTNSADGGWVNPGDGTIVLGGAPIRVDAQGRFSIELPTSTGTGLAYEVVVSYIDTEKSRRRGQDGQSSWSSGEFQLTADADLADLANDSTLRITPSMAAQLAGRIDGYEDHGNVSGALTLDPAVNAHVLTAIAGTVITFGAAPNGHKVVVLIESGVEDIAFANASETPPMQDGIAQSFIKSGATWKPLGGAGVSPNELEELIVDAINSAGGLDVTWTDPTEAQIAAAQGYWIVVSETEPEETEMFGVPVLWIEENASLTPVPVNPPAPTWDDAESEFTVPDDVIGVDYVWASGGGGLGSTLTPGATLATAGDFPRSVVITPVARAGYTLFGATSFRHDFPDPAAITLLTSEGFAGASGDFSERLTDAALGGSAWPWGDGRGNTDLLDGLVLTGTGGAATKAGGMNRALQLGPDWGSSTRNLRAEWDIVSAAINGDSIYNTPLWFYLGRAGTVPPPNGAPSIQVGLGATQLICYTPLLDGSNVELAWDNGGPLPPAGTALPAGHYTLQLYSNTVTFKMPNGSGGFVTRTAALDPAEHKAATEPWTDYNLSLAMYGANTPQQIVMDNLKISRLGF